MTHLPASETALVISVPEAETVVGIFRRRYDPSAADGMPPHITILYPFVAAGELTSQILEELRNLFKRHSRFDITLPRVRLFQQSLWLDLEPAQPLHGLIHDVRVHFPDYPPYGGTEIEIPPHLTIAILASDSERDRVHHEFMETQGACLPVCTRVIRASLMIKRAGGWSEANSFPLG